MIALAQRRYGASPLHLVGHLLCFAVAAWAILQILDAREAANIVLWLVAAAVLHDFVVLPLYAVADRAARAVLPARPARSVPLVNHVRVPVVVSAVLFLVFFPAILGRNEGNFARVAGFAPDGYLRNWLLITLALFVVSALVYAVRVARTRPA